MTRSLSELLKRNIGGDSRHRPVIRHYSLAGVTPSTTPNETVWHFFNLSNREALKNLARASIKEFSVENMLAAIAVWSYERSPSSAKALFIYDAFLSPNARLLINVAGTIKNHIYGQLLAAGHQTLPLLFQELKFEIAANLKDTLARHNHTSIFELGDIKHYPQQRVPETSAALRQFRTTLRAMKNENFLLPSALEGF